MSSTESRASFFRQSGWMVVATMVTGVCMILVHTVSAPPRLETSQYEVFAALLKLQILITIPAAALQTVFTQQAAAAVDETHEHQFSSVMRAVCVGIFALWLALLAGVSFFQHNIVTAFKISNPLTLYLTVGLALTQLWLAVVRGALQGRQKFLGLGLSMMLDGMVRIFSLAAVVLVFKGQAAGAMFSAVFGQIIALLFSLYWVRDLLTGKGAKFHWHKWAAQFFPLMGGSGIIILLSVFDVSFVQATFEKGQTKLYQAAQNIGFALFQFTAPLAMVMFPKLVKSVAKAEKTDVLKLTLISTAIIGLLAGIVCTIFPQLPLRILYFRSPEMWQAYPLVPSFVWCMLLLTMANVVVNGLLARRQYAFVPWLVALGAAYVVTMIKMRPSLTFLAPFEAYLTIIATLTAFNGAGLLLAILFAWGHKSRTEVQQTKS